MSEPRRRPVRTLVAAAAVAAGMLVTLVAAAGPAAAAESCRTVTGGSVGWFVQFMDVDGRQDVAIWRSQIRRTSNCDMLAIENMGFVNTVADTARVRTRTYNEDGSLRVDGDWVTVQMGVTRVLRRNVDAGRLVRFDVHALAGFDSASQAPARETRLYL